MQITAYLYIYIKKKNSRGNFFLHNFTFKITMIFYII